MLVPLSWLRDFAPFDLDPVALGEIFDDLGMVVEGIERVGEGLEGVVIGRVLDVRPHPDADKVRLTEVDIGQGAPLSIVCGAPNVAAGQTVPVAVVGAVLPGGFEIGRRKVRGQWSEGMICSARELHLGDDAAGIMVLSDGLALGTLFAEALGIRADVVYDLAIEGNRPDANSIGGVARDAAARLGLHFELPTWEVEEGGASIGDLATIAVDCPDLCPRFTARVITGVTIGDSSPEVVRRLTLAGMRAINNVVDASNYVMLELGQPTHPYDLDLLPGRGLLVRRAVAGEVLVTLDGVERRLGDGDDCLICDATSVPVGIGGIMGGASSEISASTTSVLLEAAYFTPMAIARTSKRLGLRSEASARFERGCDVEGIERAAARFCSLLGAGEVAAGMLDEWDRASRPVVRLRTSRVNQLLGTSLTDDEIRDYLAPIGFAATAVSDGQHDVVSPSFRPDAATEIDLVEEVARHYGYGRIAKTVPASPFVGQLTFTQRQRRRLRDVLAGAGVHEGMGSPLIGPGDHERTGVSGPFIEAVDPLARDESVLRVSLLPGLLRAVAFNQSHRVADVRLFEIGHVYLPTDPSAPLPDERERVAVVLAGPQGGAEEAKRVLDIITDAFHLDVRLQPVVESGLHGARTAAVLVGDRLAGHVGEVDPDVLAAFGIEGRVGYLGAEMEVLLPAERHDIQARAVSRFPSSDIDLAFVVDDGTGAGDVEATLRSAAGELLVDLALFDIFRDEGRLGLGRRSLAFRLRFQAPDRTLTDAEVGRLRTACIEAVTKAHPAELRG